MTKNLIKYTYLPTIAIGIAALMIYVLLAPSLFSLLPRQIKLNRDQAITAAERALHNWGYQPGSYKVSANFEVRKDLISFIQKNYPDSARENILCLLPAYSWHIEWEQPDNITKTSSNRPYRFPRWFQRVVIQLDPCGTEIGFWVITKDDSNSSSITESQAKKIADSLLYSRLDKEAESFHFTKCKTSKSEFGTEYNLNYRCEKLVASVRPSLNIIISGNLVTKFVKQYDPPQSADPTWLKYVNIVPIIVTIILVTIFALYFFVKKLRADEINFRYAAIPALFSAILMATMIGLEISSESLIGAVVGIIVSCIFSSIAMLIVVATGEALVRENWDDKLLTFDSLYRGKASHQIFGHNCLQGIALGLLLLGLTSLVIKAADLLSSLNLVDYYGALNHIASTNPFFSILSWSLLNAIWLQFAVLLISYGLLAKIIENRAWFIIAISFIFGVGCQGTIQYPDAPLWASIVNCMMMGAIFAWAFLRYDFLTSVVAHITFSLILAATRFLLLEQTAFKLYGSLIVLILISIFLFALIALKRKITIEQLRIHIPQHSLKIVERARLRRELEIARRVQLSFLPKSVPVISGLDIASLCIPAMEVGGDYYDFIQLGPKQLGVAIGDVSGKGISAAFYMTLTKGFLRSLTRTHLTPREVLVEINSLFYENVERGHFISLIFGVFDLENNQFTFARAGHNPIISLRRAAARSERLCPRGNALGLEPGEIFNKVTEEYTLHFEKGDVFVLYTDGFSEAMNASRSEFGEDRLDELINGSKGATAEQMLDSIKNHVNDYVGHSLQHDDMTMVIFRIC